MLLLSHAMKNDQMKRGEEKSPRGETERDEEAKKMDAAPSSSLMALLDGHLPPGLYYNYRP